VEGNEGASVKIMAKYDRGDYESLEVFESLAEGLRRFDSVRCFEINLAFLQLGCESAIALRKKRNRGFYVNVITSDHALNLLEQTAHLRFSPKWESVRQLLAVREVSAQQVILISCDHAGGADMSIWLALPDGNIISAIVREDSSSRCYASVVQWRTMEATDEEMFVAKRIAGSPELAIAFAKAVESYYEFYHLLGKG
jgi:hypothetical protein